MWEQISCDIFRPRGSFLSNVYSCSRTRDTVGDRLLPTPPPAHQRKVLRTNEFVRGFCLPRFWFVPRVDSLLTIADRHWRTLATMFEKAESANSLPFSRNGCLFMWGAYFYMGAYKHDVVAEIKMGAYIHGVLILCGCYYPNFTTSLQLGLVDV